MACFTNPKLLFLALVVVYVALSNQEYLGVKADQKLIDKECRNADVPTTCMQCLKSDPTSPQADRVGIATIVVKCLETRLRILSENITSAASETKGSVKKALEECKKSLGETEKDLLDAKSGLKEAAYDGAAESLTRAVQNPFGCQTQLQILQFHDSPDIFFHISLFLQLYNAAVRIIDRL